MRKVIWLQTATVFWLGGGITSLSCGVSDVRRTEIHTAGQLAPEPSAFDVQLAIEKLKRHKSPGIDQIPAELIKTGGRTIPFETNILINSIWNKEAQWKKYSAIHPQSLIGNSKIENL